MGFSMTFEYPVPDVEYMAQVAKLEKSDAPNGEIVRIELECEREGDERKINHKVILGYNNNPGSYWYRFCKVLLGKERLDDLSNPIDSDELEGGIFRVVFIKVEKEDGRINFPMFRIYDEEEGSWIRVRKT